MTKPEIKKDTEKVKLPCLNCGIMYEFDIDSNEAKGILNVFCADSDCEDEHAFRT